MRVGGNLMPWWGWLLLGAFLSPFALWVVGALVDTIIACIEARRWK